MSAVPPIEPLQRALASRADSGTRDWWQNYVKDAAPFRGVKMAVIRAEVARWRDTCVDGSTTPVSWMGTACELIRQEHSEDKLAGILLLAETLAPAGVLRPSRDLPRFGALFSKGHLADWNVVDWFCVKVLGGRFREEGRAWAEPVARWRDDRNLWRARASLVPFTTVADDRSFDGLLQQGCAALLQREERFAKTAVGWALREAARHDRGVAREIVDAHLPLFSTEALRNATKHWPIREREARLRRFRTSRRGS